MPTTQEYFLAALKSVLDTRKISQREIADTSGIAPQTVSNIVNEVKPSGLNNQERIAQACGYELVDFLGMGRELLSGAVGEEGMSRQEAAMAVGELIEQLSAAEEKLRLWRTAVALLMETDKTGE